MSIARRLAPILVFTLVFVLLAASPAAATCWLCAAGDGGAKCLKQNIANFSMTRCETRCIYFISSVCFCRTYGDQCIEPAPATSPDEDKPSLGLERESRYWLTPETVRGLQHEAGELVAGFLDWPIPAAMRGPGPHLVRGVLSVDAESYEFTGEITFYYGTAVIHYELEDHPELQSINAQFGIDGFGGTVLVERHSGLEEYEISGD